MPIPGDQTIASIKLIILRCRDFESRSCPCFKCPMQDAEHADRAVPTCACISALSTKKRKWLRPFRHEQRKPPRPGSLCICSKGTPYTLSLPGGAPAEWISRLGY